MSNLKEELLAKFTDEVKQEEEQKKNVPNDAAKIEADRLAEEERLRIENEKKNENKGELSEEVQEAARLEEEKKNPKKTIEEILNEAKEKEAQERKEARLKKMSESKAVNLFFELEEEGKDINEIASIYSKLKDFDTKDLTDDDIIAQIANEERDENGNPLSQEALEEQIETLKAMPKKAQTALIEQKRAAMEKSKQEFIDKYQTPKGKAIETIKEVLPIIDNKAIEIYGKEQYGVIMDEQLTVSFRQEAQRQIVSCTKHDGTIDSEKVVSNALKIALFDKIQEASAEASRKAALKEAFDANHSPSSDTRPVKGKTGTEKTREQQEDEALKAFLAARNPLKKVS